VTRQPQRLIARPLTQSAFAPFGEVIETRGASSFLINEGTTRRYHDLARVDVGAEDGHPLVSIFRGEPFVPPVEIAALERHPLGSQAFFPLSANPFLVVVAEAGTGRLPGDVHGFLAAPGQGVNYARNAWHHSLLSLGGVSDFLVVDRGGPGGNLEECRLERPLLLDLPAGR
jgi:ureidoglycolate lyase